MKKICCRFICSASLFAFPLAAAAADISVDSSTIFRFESRDISGAKKQTLLPATKFLGLDVDKLADGNLSLHFNGWGRYDLADKSFNNEKTGGSFTYGYLQYRLNAANADIRAGRLFVHEGIVNEQIDGVSVRTDLPLGFGFSAFGGANVHTRHLADENSDGKGDGNFGGRINYRYKGMLELGASGQYETNAPTLINHITVNHRLVGGDVWLSPHKSVELMGHTSYNTETRGVAEHTYLLNVKPLKHLVLTGEFNEHRERNYFYTWVMFSQLRNPSEKSRSLGGSASYEFSKAVEVAADYKHYTREFGNADRYGADLKLSFLDHSVRSGLGYHYLRAGREFAISGSGNPSASYHELRAYAMHDTKTYFASVDVLDFIFNDKINNEKNAWEAQASLGYHFTPALAVSGDFSYGRNPEFTEEIKGLVRLTYNMTFDSKGGKK
ncbi:MAG: hypothetical protein JJE30_09485 [Desulfuromonadales bacterium]|nr:hypothetical protein [Desulfuromonadales bacterium]